MDLNVLKTFVAVCEYGGFSNAGEKLGYTQSTVSSQIKQLEKELNTTLFDRLHHRVAVTQDGIKVLKYAREILASHQKMLTSLHQDEEASGEIRLAMANSISSRYFGDTYLQFQKQFPHIRLTITESGTQDMFDMLRKNEADLVFTLDTHIYSSEFIICAERQENVHFVVSSCHPLSKKKSLKLKDIVNESFIMTEKGMSYRKLLEEKLAEQSLEIFPQLEIGNAQQICSLIKKGNSISFLPDFITKDDVDSGNLVYLPIEDCHIVVWTQLLIHQNKWRFAALDKLIDYLTKLL